MTEKVPKRSVHSLGGAPIPQRQSELPKEHLGLICLRAPAVQGRIMGSREKQTRPHSGCLKKLVKYSSPETQARWAQMPSSSLGCFSAHKRLDSLQQAQLWERRSQKKYIYFLFMNTPKQLLQFRTPSVKTAHLHMCVCTRMSAHSHMYTKSGLLLVN